MISCKNHVGVDRALQVDARETKRTWYNLSSSKRTSWFMESTAGTESVSGSTSPSLTMGTFSMRARMCVRPDASRVTRDDLDPSNDPGERPYRDKSIAHYPCFLRNALGGPVVRTEFMRTLLSIEFAGRRFVLACVYRANQSMPSAGLSVSSCPPLAKSSSLGIYLTDSGRSGSFRIVFSFNALNLSRIISI